jgi:sugar lactone lactonase YvrE
VYTLYGQNPPSIQMYSNQGQFLRSFADFGYWAPGYFREEEGIYVDSAGTMYIADTNNNRLQIFDSRWNFVGMIQTIDLENGAFISPSGVAESPDGDIYVIDRDLFRVQAFDESGQFKRQFGNPGIDFYFRNPACIAISPQGSIVIGDRLYLYIFPNASSEPWYSSIGTGGRYYYPFCCVAGMAFRSDGVLFASYTTQDRVFGLSNPTLAIGGTGTSPGRFRDPSGLALDLEGNIFVADSQNNRIQMFGSDGQLRTVWGAKGPEEGHFINPVSVAIGGDGSIYVLDQGNSRVQKFRFDQTETDSTSVQAIVQPTVMDVQVRELRPRR